MLLRLLFRKLGNDFSQRTERQVDVLEFVQVLCARKLLKVDLLGAGQVADVELGSLEHAVFIGFVTFYEQLEQRVGARAGDVEAGGPLGADPLAFDQELVTLLLVGHDKLGEALDVGALGLVLSDAEAFLWQTL